MADEAMRARKSKTTTDFEKHEHQWFTDDDDDWTMAT